jgi:hypothetical protein
MVLRVYCVLKECGSAFSRCLLFRFQRPSAVPRNGAEAPSSLECLAGVARTTGLRQGGGRIYIRHPGSSRGDFQRLPLELLPTARGRLLDQPLAPVKPAAETVSAACLEGARLLPLHRVPRQAPLRSSSPSVPVGGRCFPPWGPRQPPRTVLLPRCVARGRFLCPLRGPVKKFPESRFRVFGRLRWRGGAL